MRKRPMPAFHPLSSRAVSKVSGQSIQLQSRQEVIELRVLASDLFRSRIARGRKMSDRPSWAVDKTDWGPVAAQIRTGQREVSIQTSSGKLLLRLADGSWKLLDSSENKVLSTVPG